MKNHGFIYVLINSSMKGLVKIGKTQRGTDQRADEISAATGVPSRFSVAYDIEVSDCDLAEQLIHQELLQYRENEDREFFRLSLKVAIRVVEKVSLRFPIEEEEEFIEGDRPDEDGLTPLMRSALKNDSESLQKLLEVGANPNTQTEDGSTALIMAAAKGYSRIVDLLAQAGADLNATMTDGSTALNIAESRGHLFVTNTIKYYLRSSERISQIAILQNEKSGSNHPLIIACAGNDFETAKRLLDSGWASSPVDDDGFTPLMLAASKGNLKMIELLLRCGAVPHLKNKRGETASDIAESKGRFVAANLINNFKI